MDKKDIIIHNEEQLQQATENQTVNNVFIDKAKFDQLARVSQVLAKTTIIPESYQNKAENCLIALEMATRMNVSPLVVMQNLYVVRGKPSWSGQACKMLIEKSQKFRDIKHVYTGEKGKDTWGCYLQGVRVADNEIVKGAEVTINTAKKEGWYNKSGSKWQTMPELMLAYRASAFFARVHCPESLMGLHTVEESEDIQKQESKGVDLFETDK